MSPTALTREMSRSPIRSKASLKFKKSMTMNMAGSRMSKASSASRGSKFDFVRDDQLELVVEKNENDQLMSL